MLKETTVAGRTLFAPTGTGEPLAINETMDGKAAKGRPYTDGCKKSKQFTHLNSIAGSSVGIFNG
ncbi:MAG: hypothetical protein LUC87_01630 [Clostridiales bacterium]|nr:hypothetical protein [Clostridiales bacterium]